jgi:hypothetical protein
MENDLKILTNKAGELALKGLLCKLLQASIDGFIISDKVLEMVNEEIKLWLTLTE